MTDELVSVKNAWKRLECIKRHVDGRIMGYNLPWTSIDQQLFTTNAALERIERDLELFHGDYSSKLS